MPWISSSSLEAYSDICRNMVSQSVTLSTFKLNPIFTAVVGTTSHAYAVSALYRIATAPSQSISGSFSSLGLPVLSRGTHSISGALTPFLVNDTVGNPQILGTQFGPIGTDTVRFVESVFTLSSSFGDLNGKHVVEFGSNYGGLAVCMHQWWPSIATHSLIDLPEVQALSSKYFESIGMDTSSISYDDPIGKPIDIFISEYALTEFDDWITYYNTYVQPAAQGFLIRANFQRPADYFTFLATCSLDFSCSVFEEPKYRYPNKLVCGYKL